MIGGPLYASAAGSEAVQLELAGTCPSDVALRLDVVPDPTTGVVDRNALRAVVADVPLVVEPVLQEVAVVSIGLPTDDGATRRGVVVSRDGWIGELGLDRVDRGALVAQRSTVAVLGIEPGDVIRLGPSATGSDAVEVVFDRSVDDIPVLPEPTFWCGLRDALRPNGVGDPPPPLLFATSATLTDLTTRSGLALDRSWEVGVADVRTLGDARRVLDGFRRALQRHEAVLAQLRDASGTDAPGRAARIDAGVEGMSTVVRRGDALAEAIGRAVAPVRLAGVLSAGAVLLAAAAMLARERHRELRLAALRGVPPLRTASRLWVASAPAAALGAAAGAGLAVLAVRTLGPTPELEAAVVLRAVLAASAAVVVAGILVAGTAALVGDRFVDRPPRQRTWRLLPWEAPIVALAVVSHRRLGDGGGLRFTGVESRGGDLLAQAFPLLALAAVAIVTLRPMRWAVGRVRRSGSAWPLPIRLGWRRATAEPTLTAAVVAAVIAAVGAVNLSGMLSSSATAGLDDKAVVYVGSDLAVTMATDATVPPALAARATVVARVDAELVAGDSASTSVAVMGVDRATFAAVARSTAGVDLEPLLESLVPGDGGALPALVVDGRQLRDRDTLQLLARDVPIEVRPVASAAEFPGLRGGTTLVVVDAAALRGTGADVVDVVWLRDPPVDAVQQLVDGGNLPAVVVNRSDVFDVVSFRAQRWTYDLLAALGVLVGIVVLVLQLLVAEARAARRRMSGVVLARTGTRARDRWTSALVETSVPLVVGGVVGAVTARVVAGLAVGRLDPLPTLAPTVRLVVPVGVLAAAAALVAIVMAVLAVVTARSDVTGDPMEVMRGTA